jgi:drug/metabolite transporter (DMT)-like permease
MTEIPPPRYAWSAYAAFAGCCTIWGSTFLVIQLGNDSLPPMWASVLLLALMRALRVPFPRGAALKAAVWFGFLNFGLSFCLLYWGETRVPSGLTAIVYATIPLTSSLFARGFGLERLSRAKLVGAVIAICGVGVIFSGAFHGAISGHHLLAILVAATCASLSGVFLKRGPRQHPFGANAAGALTGLPVCLAGSFLAREPHPLPLAPAEYLPMLYLATFGSVGAFGLYAWLVNRWPVSRVSFIAVVVPVVAVGLGAIAHHERLLAAQIAGAALVIAGLALAIASDRGNPQAH